MPNQFDRSWTAEEIEFVRNNIRKLTYQQMGKTIKRSPASIQSKVRFLPFQQKVKKHFVNSRFFKTWSPEMSYVLGFIAADGNICHSGRAHTLHIACDDEDVIQKIKQVMAYDGPIHQKCRINGKISYSLRICDPLIFNDLNNLGVTERKSLTFIPPQIPPNLTCHFVRGFFDGDGSVSLRGSKEYKSKLVVNMYTASQKMADYLYILIRSLLPELYHGKVCRALAHQKTPYYTIHLGHHASVGIFKYMYNGATIFMNRKYTKFIEGISYGT